MRAPPGATVLSWAVVVVALTIAVLGGLLPFPDWFEALSPFSHVPHLPAEDFDPLPLLALTALGALLTTAGLLGFRHRDLEGA
jgi:ABC-2 type transport system permease protein